MPARRPALRQSVDIHALVLAARTPAMIAADERIAALVAKRATASIEDCYGINEEIAILQDRRRAMR